MNRNAHRFIFPIVLFTGIAIFASCGKSSETKLAPVSISVPKNWLTLVAIDQGFFMNEGLDVTLKYYPSGKRALRGMLRGEVDISATAVTPFVFSSLKRSDISIFAVVGTSKGDNKIVARGDRGIKKPADLKGKRVATQGKSAAHFFLYLFLLKHGLFEKELEISFLKVEQLPKSLGRGDVDAISTREPFFSEAVKLLGDKAVVFTEPGLYHKTFQLVAFKDFIREKPEIIRKVLRGMIQAERFVRDHQDQAIKVIAKVLEIPVTSVANEFRNLDLTVKLDQALLLSLEEEARWVLKLKGQDVLGILLKNPVFLR